MCNIKVTSDTFRNDSIGHVPVLDKVRNLQRLPSSHDRG